MAEKSSCSGNCGSCSENCSSRGAESMLEPAGEYSNISRVYAVMSGKGGVGKSTVTSMLAVTLARRGYKVGILDADITGPSIPKAFGVNSRAMQNELGILPAQTESGIKIISVNMMLENEESPVVWRGPVIAGAVRQFWHDVVWGELDYLLVDCPPGTGDVPLTVFQSIPLNGAFIVTSPQELVSLIVKKALNMAEMMKIPVCGIIENMSYFRCPDCGHEFSVFGNGAKSLADETGVPLLGRLPIDSELAALTDRGQIESFSGNYLDLAADAIEK